MMCTRSLFIGLFIFFLILSVVCVGAHVGWERMATSFFDEVESSKHRWVQALIINGVLVTLIVCCMPGPGLMLILDGFFFGFWPALALGITFEYIGALISWLLAHVLFKRQARELVSRSDTLQEAFQVCEMDRTGSFLVLFRFLFIPVWVKNYGLALLDINVFYFCLVIFPGELFYTSIFTYVGDKGRSVAEHVRKGETNKVFNDVSGLEVVIFAVSLLGGALLGILGFRAYRQRREALECKDSRDELAPLIAEHKA